MKHRDDFQELWRDTLDEGQPRDFACESLARMLGSARSRRRRKIAARAGLGTALVLALLTFLFVRQTPPATTSPVVVEAVPASPPPVAPAHAAPRAIVVETIDDEELLAAFAGRPVLLVGSGESKQIVLLDQKK
jgi:hypothetical protein